MNPQQATGRGRARTLMALRQGLQQASVVFSRVLTTDVTAQRLLRDTSYVLNRLGEALDRGDHAEIGRLAGRAMSLIGNVGRSLGLTAPSGIKNLLGAVATNLESLWQQFGRTRHKGDRFTGRVEGLERSGNLDILVQNCGGMRTEHDASLLEVIPPVGEIVTIVYDDPHRAVVHQVMKDRSQTRERALTLDLDPNE